jgi:hypothetical protein
MRALSFFHDQLVNARTCSVMLEQPGLLIEPLQRPQLLLPSESGVTNGGFQHAYRLVVNPKRHGERVPILATVSERKSSRVGEAERGSMHDLGHHGQGAHGPRSHSRSEQQVGEVGWPTSAAAAKLP